MELHLYNTMTRKMDVFTPRQKDKVGFYACGPTVYNFAHIGNMRTYVSEDVLRRTLEFLGYDVEHVMNVTDVGHLTSDGDEGEDKMIKAAREQGKTVWDIAEFFTQAFFRDSELLNVTRPTVVCKATDHITDMIDLIKRLEKNGFTYIADGNVYFDIQKLDDYGKLAKLDLEEQQAGARIAVDEAKKNPFDFVLWFANGKFENQAMQWDSPWGRGYPGWHLECSAMSVKYLGETFDIHAGGVDHIRVHHTNEIAQTEAATGKPWVNYWMHCEFMLMKDQGKMSKSKGGFITLQTLLDAGYDALDYRYFLLSGHYRSQLQFSYESMDAAKSARKKAGDRIKKMLQAGASPAGELNPAAKDQLEKFTAHIAADLNTPRCFADMWAVLKDKNLEDSQKLAVLEQMDRVLGLDLLNIPAEEEKQAADVDPELAAEMEALIAERNEARKNKDFARADEIRDSLKARGIQIIDGPQGTSWEKV